MRKINVSLNGIDITEKNKIQIDAYVNKKWVCLSKKTRLKSDFYVNSDGVVLKSSQYLLVLFMESRK